MSSDLRDFYPEATFRVPQLHRDDPDLVIKIEKFGGGMAGEAYIGVWRYVVDYYGWDKIFYGQDLKTPTPHTHEDAARLLASILSAYGDPDSAQVGPRPTGPARRMCQYEHDRLSLWASGNEDQEG